MKARNRPPRLQPRAGVQTPAPPPTVEQLLMRAKVAGRGAVGPTELRRLVDRIVAADPGALGGLGPVGASAPEVWEAVRLIFGASPERPEIDPALTAAAAGRVASRLACVAASGARVAFATTAPASMLGVFTALARRARAAGAEVIEDDDTGPVRIDGRSSRWIRWIEGVAAVTDGRSLLATRGPDAPQEWLFQIGRPSMVVADGWFAEAAFEAGVEVIAFSGLDRAAVALPAARGVRCMVVPADPGRPPRAYGPLVDLLEAAFEAPPRLEM